MFHFVALNISLYDDDEDKGQSICVKNINIKLNFYFQRLCLKFESFLLNFNLKHSKCVTHHDMKHNSIFRRINIMLIKFKIIYY